LTIKYHSTVLFVRDIAASRYFYETLLGQRVSVDYGPNVGFEGGFGIWQIEHALDHVFGETAKASGALGRANLETYFECKDMDAVWDRLVSAGVKAVHPLIEQSWGQRVLRVYDPDGHIVEIGEPLPAAARRLIASGKTVEQIAEQMTLLIETVREMLGDGGKA
jgi:catechol 2,3-dioxygenase-like lactoylglutathione lyase family enzyme